MRSLLGIPVALIGIPFSLCSPRAECNATIQVRLLLDGQDVTGTHKNDLVRFLPHFKLPDGTRPLEVSCNVGQLCSVPPGSWGADLESGDTIAETRPQVYVEEVEPRPVLLTLILVRAAYVTLPGVPPGGMLQALDQKVAVLHSRRVREQPGRLRIPAGRDLILCGYDVNAHPLGCRHVLAKPGETVSLPGLPSLARGRGQLYVDFKYPSRDAPHDLGLSLRQGESSIPADAVVNTHLDRSFAIWYDVPSGAGVLEAASRYWATPGGPLAVDVPQRAISERNALPLVRRPTLEARLSNPALLGAGTVEWDLLECRQFLEQPAPPVGLCKEVAVLKAPAPEPVRFAGLAPAYYAVRWRKPPLQAVSWVDMRDARSRTEVVPVHVTEVHGRVTRKGDAYPVQMLFSWPNTEIRIRTRTDDSGRYHIQAAQPGDLHVLLKDETGREYSNPCKVSGEPETTCDFDVPANEVTVHVRTAQGEPLPAGAKVNYELFDPPPLSTRKDFGFSLPLDGTGSVILPPLPVGMLRVSARAEGYRVANAAPVQITKDTVAEQVEVVLENGAGIIFRITDPAGRPAAKAWIRSGNYGARADGEGVAKFDNPLASGAPLVGWDDATGSMFFTRYDGSGEQLIPIPAPGPIFRVKLQRPDGSPVKETGVIVAVDGVLDDKRFLPQCQAAGGDCITGPDGLQRVAGLPASGTLTLFPQGYPGVTVTRNLPVTDEITLTLPLAAQ